MGRKKGSRNYPLAFKRQVVAEALAAPSIAAVARKHGLNANMVHLWCKDDRFPYPRDMNNREILVSPEQHGRDGSAVNNGRQTMLNPDFILKKISDEYARRGDTHGWYFLYGPLAALQGAEVAIVGLNPGGVGTPDDICVSEERGSAYVVQKWGNHAPGQAPLQQQVRKLFEALAVDPQAVLAGNVVPFRSPSWADLAEPKSAVSFGQSLWHEIFDHARPRLVVAFGREAYEALLPAVGASHVEEVLVGWGSIKGRWAQGNGVRLIGLPHLSRFSIVGRPQSEAGLAHLFGPHWRCPEAV
ncbi:uracil-DNA glycosylase family protein [Fluviibacterium sp. DFM31]|uniref:Uracil-DNA glycosylase family protein n=1 Tax=Meridianimarinicoccus marinus TaxID=3231483 RepID=A0ABV3LAW0_9RHOB